MASISRESKNINVVEAARLRIINAFETGLPVLLSMSGGKDSICMAHLTYQLGEEGLIDLSQLTICFIDEEAVFDEVEKVVLDWRKKFLLAGAKFDWYCIQARHFNCFNSLENDESFIMWDEHKRDVWVRQPPKFAIRSHPLLRERVDTYQDFMTRISGGYMQLIGVRVSESLMRRQNISSIFRNKDRMTNFRPAIFPIYDWLDDDIWLYIKENKLDFPVTYLRMWQIGGKRTDMRLSQFFSIDTAKVLVRLNEFEPNLMERVVRREPNAYIASLYWDTELFRRKKSPKKSDNYQDDKDYRAEVMKLLADDSPSISKVQRSNMNTVRGVILRNDHVMNRTLWRDAYNILVGGDPKQRSIRGFIVKVAYESNKREKQ